MRHRLVALLAALCIIGTMGAPVLAVPQTQTTEPTTATNVIGNCNFGGDYLWTGQRDTTSSYSYSRSGVSAIIDPSAFAGDFATCNGNDISEAAAGWVAIRPRDNADPWEIIQVGVIKCEGQGWGLCDGTMRFFYAFGDCTTGPPGSLPIGRDMGPANYAPHVYTIWLDTNGYWHFQIDGAAQGTAKHKIVPNTYVKCYLGNAYPSNVLRAAHWTGERHDAGDSLGGAGSQRLLFDQARYGVYNVGWLTPDWPVIPTTYCSSVESDETCTRQNDDQLLIQTNY